MTLKMTLEDLEESLEDILPPNFKIEVDDSGEIIIYTALVQDDNGEISEIDPDDDDDPNLDDETEPLNEDDNDD